MNTIPLEGKQTELSMVEKMLSYAELQLYCLKKIKGGSVICHKASIEGVKFFCKFDENALERFIDFRRSYGDSVSTNGLDQFLKMQQKIIKIHGEILTIINEIEIVDTPEPKEIWELQKSFLYFM